MTQEILVSTSLEEFLARNARNHLYYDSAWIDVLTSIYGYTFYPLTVTQSDGRMTGYLPLCYMQSPLTGKRLVSLPFSDHCPLLAEDEASANALIDQALQLSREKRVCYLELRAGKDERLAKRSDLTSGKLYANWLVRLEENEEKVLSRLRQGARRKLKRALSQGVKVRLAESREDMREYYRLHLLTRTKKHGMPSQPLNYFLRLWDSFGANGKIHVEMAEYQGKIIAAHITAFYGKNARYMYGASDERYHELGAGYLLTWESIAWGCKHGFEVLDLGRTAYTSAGLIQYKRSWGALEDPCPYYYYPEIQGLASTSEESHKYKLLTSCWRRLPLQLSAPLGGYLYRHLG